MAMGHHVLAAALDPKGAYFVSFSDSATVEAHEPILSLAACTRLGCCRTLDF